jgi:UDP-N-acetylglucosamine--N-acetylmuramyl-(pentapeptide) pyrophosphoryl-undecaprenol N-acetylglucosamine transferase
VEYFDEKKTALTGMPMRLELLQKQPSVSPSALGLASEVPVISVFGGSLGAERVNSIILEALPALLARYEVVHQTGTAHLDLVTKVAHELITDPAVRARYHPFGFLSVAEVNAAISYASVVVSRAGSGQIFEIAHHGTPSILIPITEQVSHDQRYNAIAYARTGAAIVIEEANATSHLLLSEIDRIITDHEARERMRQAAIGFAPLDAGKTIGMILLEIGFEHGGQ